MIKNKYSIVLFSAAMLQALITGSACAANVLMFNVESQENAAKAADPPIRVVITNSGSANVRVPLMSARFEVTLYVYDQSGNVIKPVQLMPEFCSAGCTDALSLKPGDQYVPAVQSNGAWTEWVPLSAWGYPHLAPGTYTIVARPGIDLGGSEIVKTDISAAEKSAQTSQSNVLTISIH